MSHLPSKEVSNPSNESKRVPCQLGCENGCNDGVVLHEGELQGGGFHSTTKNYHHMKKPIKIET